MAFPVTSPTPPEPTSPTTYARFWNVSRRRCEREPHIESKRLSHPHLLVVGSGALLLSSRFGPKIRAEEAHLYSIITSNSDSNRLFTGPKYKPAIGAMSAISIPTAVGMK
jgi:hypothetical protein